VHCLTFHVNDIEFASIFLGFRKNNWDLHGFYTECKISVKNR